MIWLILLLFTIAYSPCSIGFSLPLKRRWRSLAALLLFLLVLGVQVLLFAGVLPRSVLLPAALGSGVLIFSTPFFFLRDMVLLVLHLRKKRIPNQKYVIAGILILAGALATWGEICAVAPPAVKQVEIRGGIPESPVIRMWSCSAVTWAT